MAHLKYIQYVYTIVLSGEFMEYLYVDVLTGAVLFGVLSYVSSHYGKTNPFYYKILAFLWAVPFFFFYFILIASRDGKKPIYDFSWHSLFGTALTFILGVITMLIIDYNIKWILLTTLLFPMICSVVYFYFEMYKL